MKKISLILISLMLLTGCNNKEKELEKIKQNNENIISKIENIDINLQENNEKLLNINETTLETLFGIVPNEVENYIISVPRYNFTSLYIIIKPSKGYEQKIKTSINNYLTLIKNIYNSTYGTINMETLEYESEFSDRLDNCLEEEYNGYYIYLVTDKNTEILKMLKENLK